MTAVSQPDSENNQSENSGKVSTLAAPLYRLPLADFIGARNELAKANKSDRELAAAILDPPVRAAPPRQ